MSDNTGKGQSYPVLEDSYLGTNTPAVLLPTRLGEKTCAITIQALGQYTYEADVPGGTCVSVDLYVDTCPEAGELGVLRVSLTVAEAKHLRRVLKNALRS